jgi:hypothetical protein
MLARSGSQLVEASAAQEVPIATLVHVGGWSVQAHDAYQVIWDFVLLFLAPPGGGGGGGGGAHATMEGRRASAMGFVSGQYEGRCACGVRVRSGGERRFLPSLSFSN